MKKYLCFVLIVAMLVTSFVPVSAAGIEVRDLLDYMFELNVDPALYIGGFENFISYMSNANGFYTLREEEYMEETIEDINMYLGNYGANPDDVRMYAEEFYDFFAEKPEMFTLFMSYISNYENGILPFPQQNRLESELSGVTAAIRKNFYCETFFLNLLATINDKYYAAKKDQAFKYYEERITLKDDAVNYIDFFYPENKAAVSYAFSEVANMLDEINNMSSYEKSSFAEYMIAIGIMSLNMNDSSSEQGNTQDTVYQRLDDKYKNGNGIILPFGKTEDITAQYMAEINNAETQNAKNEIIYKAMSKAATIKIDGDQTNQNGKNVANLSSSDVLTYAVMRAQKVRNELVANNITVSKVQPFTIEIVISDNLSNGFKLTLSKSALGTALTYYADKIRITGNKGKLFGDILALSESSIFTGSTASFEVYEDSAEKVVPSLKDYAQGNNIIKILVGAGGAVDYDTMRFEKEVYGNVDSWYENNVYSIAANGDRTKVDYYDLYDNVVTFEIGNQKYFAKIDGGLEEVKPAATPTPTAKPTPTPTAKPTTKPSSNPTWEDENEKGDPVETEKPEPTVTPEETTKPDKTPDRGDGPDKYPVPDFDDVSAAHWAKEYIDKLCAKGILNGVGNNLFAPDQNVTREQFAKIIAEAFGIVDDEAQCEFTDVAKGSWYEKYVASVYNMGIVNGVGNNMFGTGQSMTRQDMATMIIRAAKACDVDLGARSTFKYNDHDRIADYAKEAVEILVECRIVSGYNDNTFRPTRNTTRAEVAKIVSGVLDIKNK